MTFKKEKIVLFINNPLWCVWLSLRLISYNKVLFFFNAIKNNIRKLWTGETIIKTSCLSYSSWFNSIQVYGSYTVFNDTNMLKGNNCVCRSIF